MAKYRAFFLRKPILNPSLIITEPYRPPENVHSQKKAVRVVAGTPYNSHTGPRFVALNILRLPDMAGYQAVALHDHLVRGTLPEGLIHLLDPDPSENRASQRHSVRINSLPSNSLQNKLLAFKKSPHIRPRAWKQATLQSYSLQP